MTGPLFAIVCPACGAACATGPPREGEVVRCPTCGCWLMAASARSVDPRAVAAPVERLA